MEIKKLVGGNMKQLVSEPQAATKKIQKNERIQLSVSTPTIREVMETLADPKAMKKAMIEYGIFEPAVQAKKDFLTSQIGLALSLSKRKDMQEFYKESVDQLTYGTGLHNFQGVKNSICISDIKKLVKTAILQRFSIPWVTLEHTDCSSL